MRTGPSPCRSSVALEQVRIIRHFDLAAGVMVDYIYSPRDHAMLRTHHPSQTSKSFSGTLPTSILPNTVLKAQEAPKAEKGLWMHRHKSLGLLTAILVAPRLGYRLFNAAKYRVGHIAGTGPLEQKAADASHLLLYGFMTIMPASGIAMGYFGGKGLPFFGTTISGIVHTDETKKGNQKIAGQAFKIHKTLGTYGKFLIPLHAAGAVQHAARGHTIFARVNPFRSPKH